MAVEQIARSIESLTGQFPGVGADGKSFIAPKIFLIIQIANAHVTYRHFVRKTMWSESIDR